MQVAPPSFAVGLGPVQLEWHAAEVFKVCRRRHIVDVSTVPAAVILHMYSWNSWNSMLQRCSPSAGAAVLFDISTSACGGDHSALPLQVDTTRVQGLDGAGETDAADGSTIVDTVTDRGARMDAAQSNSSQAPASATAGGVGQDAGHQLVRRMPPSRGAAALLCHVGGRWSAIAALRLCQHLTAAVAVQHSGLPDDQPWAQPDLPLCADLLLRSAQLTPAAWHLLCSAPSCFQLLPVALLLAPAQCLATQGIDLLFMAAMQAACLKPLQLSCRSASAEPGQSPQP